MLPFQLFRVLSTSPRLFIALGCRNAFSGGEKEGPSSPSFLNGVDLSEISFPRLRSIPQWVEPVRPMGQPEVALVHPQGRPKGVLAVRRLMALLGRAAHLDE